MQRRLVVGLAWILFFATFFLVVAGGQVTSTDSGDAVPTWPLPLRLPMTGGVFWELGHRQVAGAVGVLMLALLAAVAWRRDRLPRAVFRLSLIAFCLVVAQALLGGVRVLVGAALETDRTPLITSIGVGHTLLGQTFFCFTGAIVYFMHRPAPSPSAGGASTDSRLLRATRVASAVILGQILLGAVLRLTRPGPVPMLVLLHILGAVAVSIVVADVIFRVLRQDRPTEFLRSVAFLSGVVLAGQIGLGFVAYFAVRGDGSPASPEVTWKTVVPTLHLALGSLLLLLSVLLHLDARHAAEPRTRSPSPSPEPAGAVPGSSEL